VVLVLALLSLLAGGPATAQSGALVVAIDSDISSLDISDAATFNTGVFLGINVFDRLFEYGPGGLVPKLATAWSTSPDGLTWTFHLRKGVKFHDGTPFDADAVKFNFDRLLRTPQLRQSAKLRGVVRVETDGPYTVRVVTDRPLPALVGNLVHPAAGAIQSPTAVKDKKFPVGTGPFLLKEWVPGDHILLEANPNYWDGAPNVKRIFIRLVPEAGTRVNLLRSGQAHISVALLPIHAKELEGTPGVRVVAPKSAGWRFVGLNNSKKPFDNVAVRQALNYAVDKQAIVEKLFLGLTRAADSPYGSAMWSFIGGNGYPYNPTKAKELLAQAGYPGGFEATYLAAPTDAPLAAEVAQALQAYLGAVGVTMHIRSMEPAVLLQEVFKPMADNKVEMYQYWYGGADPDTLRILLDSREWPPGRNGSFYKDPAVDSLFEQGATTANSAKRKAIYQDVQRQVMKSAPWIFLFEERRMDGVRTNLRGITYIQQDVGILDMRRASF